MCLDGSEYWIWLGNGRQSGCGQRSSAGQDSAGVHFSAHGFCAAAAL
jgi:hypothetical protein